MGKRNYSVMAEQYWDRVEQLGDTSKEELTIASMDVAKMVTGKEHKNLMRDIRSYVAELAELKIEPGDFFKESTYKDANNQTRPCYNVTKKGCEFIAHKLTGVKGTEFTAKYINRFHDMEDAIRQGIPNNLSPQLQLLINMEMKQKEHDQKLEELDNKVDSIKEVVALRPNAWRKESSTIINKIAQKLGGYEHIKLIREELYRILEERMHVALGVRLANKKKTNALNGMCKSKLDKLNQLDVIADDPKLIEGYIAIIKEMAIKYGISVGEVA